MGVSGTVETLGIRFFIDRSSCRSLKRFNALGSFAPSFSQGSMQLPEHIVGDLGDDAKVNTQVFILPALNETACELRRGLFYTGTPPASTPLSGTNVTGEGSTVPYGDIFYVGYAWTEA